MNQSRGLQRPSPCRLQSQLSVLPGICHFTQCCIRPSTVHNVGCAHYTAPSSTSYTFCSRYASTPFGEIISRNETLHTSKPFAGNSTHCWDATPTCSISTQRRNADDIKPKLRKANALMFSSPPPLWVVAPLGIYPDWKRVYNLHIPPSTLRSNDLRVCLSSVKHGKPHCNAR